MLDVDDRVDGSFSNLIENSEDLSKPLLDVITVSSPTVDHNGPYNEPRVKTHKILIIAMVVIILALFVAVVSLSLRCKTKSKKSNVDEKLKYFFHVSDTHLDLYYDKTISNVDSEEKTQFCRNYTKKGSVARILKANNLGLYGRIGCDSSEKLLTSTAAEMNRIQKDSLGSIEFILLTGDQAAHNYRSFDVNLAESVLMSIGNSTKILSDTLDIPVFPVIGNNDLLYDYAPPITTKSSFYKSVYATIQSYIFRSSGVRALNNESDVKSTFESGGYYKLVLQGGNLVLLLLNSNYWSLKAFKINHLVTTIGDLHMTWVHDELAKAEQNGQNVILAGHIPPGVSTYSGNYTWLKNYTDLYFEMTTKTFVKTVIGQLFGHTHSDKIKLQYSGEKLSDPDQSSFLLLCPSITPLYKNNPAFRVVSYDENKIQDYTQYHLDLTASNVFKTAHWQKEYSFRETYKEDLSVSGVISMLGKLLDAESTTWFHYSSHVRSQYNRLSSDRFIEYCGARYCNLQSYQTCLNTYKDRGA